METLELLRLLCFFAVLALLAIIEQFVPKRMMSRDKLKRWACNIGLTLFNTVLVKLLVPATTVSVAWYANEQGWGLLQYTQWPIWLTYLVAIIVLDLAIYWQHRCFHAIPSLWRLHSVHHSDHDIDVSTALRFHPLEICLSLGFKLVIVLLLGIPAAAIIIFEILLNAMAMFNHSNIQLRTPLDRVLRLAVVTPDMHRVHHSQQAREIRCNFGFNLSCWDHCFNSYLDQPENGHQRMNIGLAQYAKQELSFSDLLRLPFTQQ